MRQKRYAHKKQADKCKLMFGTIELKNSIITSVLLVDIPGSPCKQPRISLKDPPSTPNQQTNSFSQPMTSPRVNKRQGMRNKDLNEC